MKTTEKSCPCRSIKLQWREFNMSIDCSEVKTFHLNSEQKYIQLQSGCQQCNNIANYNCLTCACRICLRATSSGTRLQCFICKKVFHESCLSRQEFFVDTKWLCSECKIRHSFYPGAYIIKNNNAGDQKSSTELRVNDLSPAMSIKKVASEVVDLADKSEEIDSKENIVEKVVSNLINEQANKVHRKMHHAPRRSVNTTVPRNHFGPIPGIEVGSSWKFRLQVSESGVHRPLVAGIHGREREGAYSIVLSGVYAQDLDKGNEFYYSGCGGRPSDPTKRFAQQTKDMELTNHNKALALCCNAPINDVNGAEAEDWMGGKPIRVVRKAKVDNPFAPDVGYRYEGIYKLVKYFPITNDMGLRVWQYFLRRDDPIPAPWTEEGKERIAKLNLKIALPEDENYEELEMQQMQVVNAETLDTRKRRLSYVPQIHPIKRPVENTQRRYLTRLSTGTWSPINYSEDKKPIATDLETSLSMSWTTNMAHNLTKVQPEFDDVYYDVKPKLKELNRMTTDVERNETFYDVKPKLRELTNVPVGKDNICEAEEPSCTISTVSSIDVHEDVKPDLTALNALLERDDTSILLPNVITKANDQAILNARDDVNVSQPMEISELQVVLPPISRNNEHAKVASKEKSLYVKISSVSSKTQSTSAPVIKNVKSVGESESIRIPETLKSGNMLNGLHCNGLPIKEQRVELPNHLIEMFCRDGSNEALWESLKTSKNREEFVLRMKLALACPCCNNIVKEPVTTPCGHNICYKCMENHYESGVCSCPQCCDHLGTNFLLQGINKNMMPILEYYYKFISTPFFLTNTIAELY